MSLWVMSSSLGGGDAVEASASVFLPAPSRDGYGEVLSRAHDSNAGKKTLKKICERAHRTTLSSFISLSKLISRIAVLGTPSSSASSRIFFSATIWFVSLFRERYCSRAKRAKGKSRGAVVQHRF